MKKAMDGGRYVCDMFKGRNAMIFNIAHRTGFNLLNQLYFYKVPKKIQVFCQA
jgi:hypothetical protein